MALQEVINTEEAVCLAGLALISVISLTSCAALSPSLQYRKAYKELEEENRKLRAKLGM